MASGVYIFKEPLQREAQRHAQELETKEILQERAAPSGELEVMKRTDEPAARSLELVARKLAKEAAAASEQQAGLALSPEVLQLHGELAPLVGSQCWCEGHNLLQSYLCQATSWRFEAMQPPPACLMMLLTYNVVQAMC